MTRALRPGRDVKPVGAMIASVIVAVAWLMPLWLIGPALPGGDLYPARGAYVFFVFAVSVLSLWHIWRRRADNADTSTLARLLRTKELFRQGGRYQRAGHDDQGPGRSDCVEQEDACGAVSAGASPKVVPPMDAVSVKHDDGHAGT